VDNLTDELKTWLKTAFDEDREVSNGDATDLVLNSDKRWHFCSTNKR
jgi:hypothetical protein